MVLWYFRTRMMCILIKASTNMSIYRPYSFDIIILILRLFIGSLSYNRHTCHQ